MSWRPTFAHVRTSAAGIIVAAAGVLARRPDLLVLATPFLAISGWSTWLRPRSIPVVHERLDHHTLREGEATTMRIVMVVPPGGRGTAEAVAAVLAPPPYTTLDPGTGQVCGPVERHAASVELVIRSTRWGRRAVGPARVVATSAWGGFSWTPVGVPEQRLTTLPMPAAFDTAAPAVHPVGLVGLSRSARPGDGSEFASVRAFQSGDRLRRIHWPRSLRSGSLHVTSTWADQDSHVVIVVDAFNDLGPSEGIDGSASSLDTTVRAAGAIAEHHLHRGDRVALHVLGSRGVMRVPTATGTAHLRRVLDTLAAIEPATDRRDDSRLHLGLSAGALVVMLSPLISPMALQRAFTLASRGLTVVVVDTLPARVSDEDADDPFLALAWRIRLLERRREMRRIRQVGVPIVEWRGPGSLDQVLRDLHRRSAAPRVVRR